MQDISHYSQYIILFLKYVVMPTCILATLLFKIGLVIKFICEPDHAYGRLRRTIAASVPFTTLAFIFANNTISNQLKASLSNYPGLMFLMVGAILGIIVSQIPKLCLDQKEPSGSIVVLFLSSTLAFSSLSLLSANDIPQIPTFFFGFVISASLTIVFLGINRTQP